MRVAYQPHRQTFRFDGGNAPADDRVFDAQSLRWAEFNAVTGDLVQAGTDWSCKPSNEQLDAWQAVARTYAQMWGQRLDDLHSTFYIRYGNVPKGGRSTNYATGRKEQGVSVYAATYDLNTGAIVFDGRLSGAGTLAFVSSDRTPHLVTGHYVGDGSDGEPLLRQVQVVAELSYDASLEGFLIHGNDEEKERTTITGESCSSLYL
ncbi:hypothetical protein [Dictyobacter arantiisoli]|uniref:Uncharacterized protein n=1 Tax=Dictyobacter arantiisoli TaxID=2014874 RepID=A0A5A5TLE4_9CHLR|nr:hypothetical protein [Dictyobacter arantiisoli]GCF11986.1 hypothetical protein KDI_55500 [Dictyobacter arantiisoli]